MKISSSPSSTGISFIELLRLKVQIRIGPSIYFMVYIFFFYLSVYTGKILYHICIHPSFQVVEPADVQQFCTECEM
jgi:hypothetical protein